MDRSSLGQSRSQGLGPSHTHARSWNPWIFHSILGSTLVLPSLGDDAAPCRSQAIVVLFKLNRSSLSLNNIFIFWVESWSSHIERLIDIIDNLHVCTLQSHSGVFYVGYFGVVMISLTSNWWLLSTRVFTPKLWAWSGVAVIVNRWCHWYVMTLVNTSKTVTMLSQ